MAGTFISDNPMGKLLKSMTSIWPIIWRVDDVIVELKRRYCKSAFGFRFFHEFFEKFTNSEEQNSWNIFFPFQNICRLDSTSNSWIMHNSWKIHEFRVRAFQLEFRNFSHLIFSFRKELEMDSQIIPKILKTYLVPHQTSQQDKSAREKLDARKKAWMQRNQTLYFVPIHCSSETWSKAERNGI